MLRSRSQNSFSIIFAGHFYVYPTSYQEITCYFNSLSIFGIHGRPWKKNVRISFIVRVFLQPTCCAGYKLRHEQRCVYDILAITLPTLEMDLKTLLKDNKVVLFGYTDCPYTNESARTLDSLGVSYKRINLCMQSVFPSTP